MNPVLAATLIDGALGLVQIGLKSAMAIKKAAAQGGEFTQEQRDELDERIRVALLDRDILLAELEAQE